MAYTLLTMNERVRIETYYDNGAKSRVIVGKMSSALQTIYNVVSDLKEGSTI